MSSNGNGKKGVVIVKYCREGDRALSNGAAILFGRLYHNGQAGDYGPSAVPVEMIELESEGLVRRGPSMLKEPPGIGYVLTPKGRELGIALERQHAWC